MKRAWMVLIVGLWLGIPRPAPAALGTVFGGSLLKQGDVTLTFGVGFPDLFFQFDFANTDDFNLALAFKFNYNLGFSLFGANFFGLVPLRFSLVQGSELSLAFKLEPGIFVGFDPIEQLRYLLGVQVGLGFLGTYQIIPKVGLIFGLEIPVLLNGEVIDRDDIFGANLPFEFFVGAEYKINNDLSIYLKLAGGPFLYIGNLAYRLSGDISYRVLEITGIIRLLFGIEWRR